MEVFEQDVAYREDDFLELHPTYEAIISSITSINLSKIVFALPHLTMRLGHPNWMDFDGWISALADKLRKLGNKQTLEVEFRFVPVVSDLKGFLPKFRERGRVRIVDLSNGQVLELELAVCFPFFPVLCCPL